MREASLKIITYSSFLVLYSSLPARFKNSKFDNKHDLADFTKAFDSGLKTTFSDNTKPQFVKFCRVRENDTRCGVSGGKFNLPG